MSKPVKSKVEKVGNRWRFRVTYANGAWLAASARSLEIANSIVAMFYDGADDHPDAFIAIGEEHKYLVSIGELTAP